MLETTHDVHLYYILTKDSSMNEVTGSLSNNTQRHTGLKNSLCSDMVLVLKSRLQLLHLKCEVLTILNIQDNHFL
jgi:hypothetical protein